MKQLLTMFLSFFKIGAFTFGGGFAMLPLIEVEVVNKQNWISKEEFLDILTISQSFPGGVAINCSIFIGYKIKGITGAVIALLGTILPSFFIILIIASYFTQFRANYYVNLIFKGIGSAVPMLVLIAVVSLSSSVKKTYVNGAIILIVILLVSIMKINPVIVIILAGIYGYLYYGKKATK